MGEIAGDAADAPETRFDFRAFPVLTTPRLTLRQVTPDDAEGIFAFRSDPLVSHYNADPYTDPEEARALIARLRRQFDARVTLSWALTLNDRPDAGVIGLCGYAYWARESGLAEIGFDLARDHWGRGLMPEAARAVVDFGFARMKLHKIVAEVRSDNHASVRVMAKLGFALEGVLREQTYEAGRYYDEHLYGLLRREHRPG